MDTMLDPQKKPLPSSEDNNNQPPSDPTTDGRLSRLEVNLATNTDMLNKILELLQSVSLLDDLTPCWSDRDLVIFLGFTVRIRIYSGMFFC